MSTRNLDKLFDPRSIAVDRRLQQEGVGRLHPPSQPHRRGVRRRRLPRERIGAVGAGHPGVRVDQPGPPQDRPRGHRRAGQGRARDDARVRRSRRGRRRHRVIRVQGDRRRRQEARRGRLRHRRELRRAHRRPQLPRLHPPGHEPQRDLRPGDPAGRSRGVLQPVGCAGHRSPRLGGGQPRGLLRLRERRFHGRRGLRRPHRLLRRRHAHEQHHPVHRVHHRRAQVHERGAPLRQEQAHHRGQERPHGAQRASRPPATPAPSPATTPCTAPPSAAPASCAWTRSKTCSTRARR